MGLFVKRYDTGEIVQVKKYVIDLQHNEESIWSNDWYGRHVIGSHCEWCESKETSDEIGNCIKPDVTTMLPRESDMENKISDAKQHQSNEHQQFKAGYELGYRHCYSWMVRIISLFGN